MGYDRPIGPEPVGWVFQRWVVDSTLARWLRGATSSPPRAARTPSPNPNVARASSARPTARRLASGTVALGLGPCAPFNDVRAAGMRALQ